MEYIDIASLRSSDISIVTVISIIALAVIALAAVAALMVKLRNFRLAGAMVIGFIIAAGGVLVVDETGSTTVDSSVPLATATEKLADAGYTLQAEGLTDPIPVDSHEKFNLVHDDTGSDCFGVPTLEGDHDKLIMVVTCK